MMQWQVRRTNLVVDHATREEEIDRRDRKHKEIEGMKRQVKN